ncbi:Core-binding factor subunit beta [Trichoplax sp. H2]|nr:Core-binding factor subunit beta [Trichoplax sp. H2]|eukprot:RDD47137.1 Core-binding factor subunit beta [Trichoplax sp. H2]
MPRVVPDQKFKFESDELFRKLSRDSEIKYAGFPDRSHEERVMRFQSDCREGYSIVTFVSTGTNLELHCKPAYKDTEDKMDRDYNVDIDNNAGKIYLTSSFIMNGVCVKWKGWLDVQRLEGLGCLEFNEEMAKVEDRLLRESLQLSNDHISTF